MTFGDRVLKLLEADLVPYLRLGSRGLNRKNLRQVPDSHKVDPTLNSKVENMRVNRQDGATPLNRIEVEDLFRKYNISGLKPGESKQLGTSNMMISMLQNGTYNLSTR